MESTNALNSDLIEIKELIYDKCAFQISNVVVENESAEYYACRFDLNGLKVISRNAKITPKKNGQFVTFWKRIKNGPIEPFNESDRFNFFVVNIRAKNHFGQFIFPKSELIKRGVISTNLKEGKRAIRVYPPWDEPENKHAEKTQKWQLKYFLMIGGIEQIDFSRVKMLYAQK